MSEDATQRYVKARAEYMGAVKELMIFGDRARSLGDRIRDDWPSLVSENRKGLPPAKDQWASRNPRFKPLDVTGWPAPSQVADVLKKATESWQELEAAYNAIDPEFRKAMETLAALHEAAVKQYATGQ